jgi:Ca-activated chloride channel family protein
MDALTTRAHLRQPAASDAELEQAVTILGLTYSLSTRWTSFVAVSEKIVNADPAGTKTAGVPLHKVDGVTAKAYGRMGGSSPSIPSSQRAFNSFSGGSTPEPGLLGGLAVLTLAGLAGLYRRRRTGS